jgi:quercetin dioxygenase-like cupin family protein
MLMQSKLAQFGKLDLTIYDAKQEGEILPMHSHEEDSIHITIVARGSFKAHGDGWEMIAKEGDVIDWRVGQNHELIALEPNSRFINIMKA